MLRNTLVALVIGLLFIVGSESSLSQASKRLGDRAPKSDPQKDAWNQVDKINRETDGTKSRNAQARKAGKLDEKKYTGGKVTKRHVLPSTPKKPRKQEQASLTR